MENFAPTTGLPGSLFISDDRADLNRGFQHLTYGFTTGSAFTDETLNTASMGPGPLASEGWLFKIDVIDSKNELMEKIDLKASGKASLWGVQVRGQASWMNQIEVKEETVLVVVSAKKVVKVTPFNPSKLHFNPDAMDRMEKGDFKGFYERYGSYFVGKVSLGGELNLLFRRDFQSRQEKLAASAELKAQGSAWSADASAAQDASSVFNKYQMHVEGYGIGGIIKIPNMGNWTADKALDWALNTWMGSVDENTAGVLQLEMMNIWTAPGGDPAFVDFLRQAQENYDGLSQCMLRLDGLLQLSNYLLRDVENCAPTPRQVAKLKNLVHVFGSSQQSLYTHVEDARNQSSRGLAFKRPADVLGNIELDDLENELRELEHKLAFRRPLTKRDRFRLRTTGENNYYFAGPHKNMGPLMDARAAQAEPLRFDGNDPTVGAEVRIHSIRGIGNKHMVTAMGRNNWLQYQRGDKSRNTWKIEQKRDGGDLFVRSGDRIRLTSVQYPDMTIKAEKEDGINWGKAKAFKNHWLLIERIEAPVLKDPE